MITRLASRTSGSNPRHCSVRVDNRRIDTETMSRNHLASRRLLTALLITGCVDATMGMGAAHTAFAQWERIDTASGLAGNNVLCVFQDSRERYWFGTTSGLSQFDGAR